MLRPGELEIAANAPPAGCSQETAQQFTKWLATHHYENFNASDEAVLRIVGIHLESLARA